MKILFGSFLLSLLAVYNPHLEKPNQKNTFDEKVPYRKLSCDSLIDLLVRRSGATNIQPWWQIKSERLKSDSIFIKMFDSNGKGDILIVNHFLLLPRKYELQNVEMSIVDPSSKKQLYVDKQIVNLIMINCFVHK